MTVLLVYYQLCVENHCCWLLLFFASGSTTLDAFVYSMFWFQSIDASMLLMTDLSYSGYMLPFSLAMMLVASAIHLPTSLHFFQTKFIFIKANLATFFHVGPRKTKDTQTQTRALVAIVRLFAFQRLCVHVVFDDLTVLVVGAQ